MTGGPADGRPVLTGRVAAKPGHVAVAGSPVEVIRRGTAAVDTWTTTWTTALAGSLVPTAVVTLDGHAWANDAYTELVARAGEELGALSVDSLTHPEDVAAISSAGAGAATSGVPAVLPARLVRPDGEVRWVSLALTPLPGASGAVLLQAVDFTAEQEAQQELRHHATHDVLTGLPNRLLFTEHLDHAISRLSRCQGACAAVLFIDLDRVKHVNDTYGHAAGDRLLVSVAEHLRDAVRPHDVVARLGGDEFTVLLEDVCDRDQAVLIGQRCLASIATGEHVPGEHVRVTASVGVAVADSGKATATDVLAEADAAMYRAKAEGRNRVAFLDEPLPLHQTPRAALERQLAGALERGELEVHYQPIVDLTTGRITAGEALLRWRQPGHGLRSAGEFIHIAEAAGYLVDIGNWVPEVVAADLREWDERGVRVDHVYINVAGQQLADKNFVQHLSDVLTRHRVHPARLCVEITETAFMSSAGTLEQLHAVHELGCTLVVDDFGTGYSSLSRLIDLPVDVVKIDRSFIAGVGLDPRPSAVVSATLLLAHDLRQLTIAEGVETAQQHRWLVEAGCTHAQGFGIAPPVPADTFAELAAGPLLGPPEP
ncbi:MAG: EAL domain-containing protein [Actinomycetota bacterium]|nr:EAL domain-containing protein [Actinomycetota bacterium]